MTYGRRIRATSPREPRTPYAQAGFVFARVHDLTMNPARFHAIRGLAVCNYGTLHDDLGRFPTTPVVSFRLAPSDAAVSTAGAALPYAATAIETENAPELAPPRRRNPAVAWWDVAKLARRPKPSDLCSTAFLSALPSMPASSPCDSHCTGAKASPDFFCRTHL